MKLVELYDKASIEYLTKTPHHDLARRSESENLMQVIRLFLKYVECHLAETSKF